MHSPSSLSSFPWVDSTLYVEAACTDLERRPYFRPPLTSQCCETIPSSSCVLSGRSGESSREQALAWSISSRNWQFDKFPHLTRSLQVELYPRGWPTLSAELAFIRDTRVLTGNGIHILGRSRFLLCLWEWCESSQITSRPVSADVNCDPNIWHFFPSMRWSIIGLLSRDFYTVFICTTSISDKLLLGPNPLSTVLFQLHGETLPPPKCSRQETSNFSPFQSLTIEILWLFETLLHSRHVHQIMGIPRISVNWISPIQAHAWTGMFSTKQSMLNGALFHLVLLPLLF